MADTISSAGLLFLHLQGRRAGAAVDVEAMDTYRLYWRGVLQTGRAAWRCRSI